MIRTRLTWVIVGAVVALLGVAGVDALRSSDEETFPATNTASTTTVEQASSTLPPFAFRLDKASAQAEPRCTREQVGVSIEIRDGVATLVVRHLGANPCSQPHLGFRLLIKDRDGKVIGRWGSAAALFGGDLSTGFEQSFALPAVERCDSPGPFRAIAIVGPHGARRGNLSRSEITC